MDDRVNRDEQLTSLTDLEKRVELLRKNGVRIYEDGTLKLALDIGASPSAQAPDTEADLVARLRAVTGGRIRGF
jgi:hypothetical protein